MKTILRSWAFRLGVIMAALCAAITFHVRDVENSVFNDDFFYAVLAVIVTGVARPIYYAFHPYSVDHPGKFDSIMILACFVNTAIGALAGAVPGLIVDLAKPPAPANRD